MAELVVHQGKDADAEFESSGAADVDDTKQHPVPTKPASITQTTPPSTSPAPPSASPSTPPPPASSGASTKQTYKRTCAGWWNFHGPTGVYVIFMVSYITIYAFVLFLFQCTSALDAYVSSTAPDIVRRSIEVQPGTQVVVAAMCFVVVLQGVDTLSKYTCKWSRNLSSRKASKNVVVKVRTSTLLGITRGHGALTPRGCLV